MISMAIKHTCDAQTHSRQVGKTHKHIKYTNQPINWLKEVRSSRDRLMLVNVDAQIASPSIFTLGSQPIE